MKKIFSIIVFVLSILILLFNIFSIVFGGLDIKRECEELAAHGASGVDYLGVHAEMGILVIGSALISVVGVILSLVAMKLTQIRLISIVSYVLFAAHALIVFGCFCVAFI
ncbi:MAG: hypothetical protein E7653_05415 [Ruminococcaceae bacterium]|nr:hypothetical protein [Oscillospiraceae bacterium]